MSVTYPDFSTLNSNYAQQTIGLIIYYFSSKNRNSYDKTFSHNTPLEITYNFKVEPGPVTTANLRPWARCMLPLIVFLLTGANFTWGSYGNYIMIWNTCKVTLLLMLMLIQILLNGITLIP